MGPVHFGSATARQSALGVLRIQSPWAGRIVPAVLAIVFFVLSEWFYRTASQPRGEYAGLKYFASVASDYFAWSIIAVGVLMALISTRVQVAHLFVLVILIFVYNGILTTAIH